MRSFDVGVQDRQVETKQESDDGREMHASTDDYEI